MAAAHAVAITAPARLHLGFLDLNGGLGRSFGGLGLAIDRPVTRVVVERAAASSAVGADPGRTGGILRKLTDLLGLEDRYRVRVETSLPAHAGLGSGTQLALAIGTALLRLEGSPSTIRDLGDLLDRGARSAIGMAAFATGGFIVDGGRGRGTAPPPVLVRRRFPEAWRVLLVLDRAGQGVHGPLETEAFAKLPPFPEAAAGHLCRLVLMRLLPGLVERDLAAFGSAVTEIQAVVGDYFAPAQGGGRWSRPEVGRIAERLLSLGAAGIGQSSWGPTGFAFVASTSEAERLYHAVRADAAAARLDLVVAQGRNRGARAEAVPARSRK